MKKIFLIFYSFIVCTYLQADSTIPGVIASTDGDPNAIIGGCVNAITGDLVLNKEDLVVRGAVPLPLRRSYTSGNGKGYNCGWHFFFPHFTLTFDRGAPELLEVAHATLPSGSAMTYRCGSNKKGHRVMYPLITKHAVGMTNNSAGILSGRTNCKNSRIRFKEDKYGAKTEIHLVTGDGLRYYYDVGHIKKYPADPEYVLVREELPNGCWILYEHDKEGRPTLAKVVNPAQDKVFSWARFHYEGSEKDSHNIHVETSDHRQLHYVFEKRKGKPDEGGSRFYLSKVTGSDLPEEGILFATPPKGFNSLLTEIKASGELQQKVIYQYPNKKDGVKDKHDLRCNRVRELWRPHGPNGEMLCTHRITYSDIEWREDMSSCTKGGLTRVYGVNGYLAEYEWSRELRPLEIRLYDTEQHNSRRVSHEFVWGKEKSNEVGDLKARALLDCDGNYLWIKTYEYDANYNPTIEKFHGNLTGTCTKKLTLKDGKVAGGETYVHYYTYSDDGKNLLIEDREDSGRITQYQYLPGTSLVTGKLTRDQHSVLHRNFYEYDTDHLLITEISDDGTSNEATDLTHVTHRTIKRTIRRSDGLPEKIEERCYDFATGQEELLRATIMHYASNLLLTRQDILDANSSLAYSLFFEHDSQGRLIRQTDPLGQITTFTYDHLGRVIKTNKPNGLVESIAFYPSNQPSTITKLSLEGQSHTTSISYNALGHPVTTTDPHGYTTRFTADPWGRNKRIEYPDNTAEHYTYNATGFILQYTDKNGAITTKTYTSYGKPTFIQHPDGSQERFVYDCVGNLIKATNRLGTSVIYSYDLLGHIIHQKTVSPSEQTLLEEWNRYQGPHLLEHINAEGEITKWEYDAAGRKIAEHRNEAITYFAYNPLGRLASTATEDATHVMTYDHLGRMVGEKTIGQNGNLHQEISYTHDYNGNIHTTTVNTLLGPSIKQTTYDAFSRPILQIDPLGNKTTIKWDESSLGTIRKIITNPIGTQEISTMGVMGRILCHEILTPQGTRLARTSYIYDANGHCIEEHAELATRTIITKREYTFDKLTSLIEAAGTAEQKITRYSYQQDLLKSVQKNDGTKIDYTHDSLGRILTCTTNTDTGYAYSYDRLNRLITVTDLASGLTSSRTYDSSGGIQEERFLHGLSIIYKRDVLGKPLTLTLPDQSGIGYTWEAGRLREVHRLDASSRSLYSHTYDKLDLTGQPVYSSLIANLGIETYSYDSAQRLNERSTPYHTQTATARNPLGSLLATTTRILTNSTSACYTYDCLEQLESEHTPSGNHTFCSDAHGTPLSRDGNTCHTNHLYQLKGIGNFHYTYTAAGNLLTDTRYIYHYDGFDRLTSIEEPHVQKTEYVYDSWHRRMQKVLYLWKNNKWILSSTRSYLYDGMHEIGATDENGNLVELRLLGLTNEGDAGATIAIELNGHPYAPLHDLQGNITGLIDTASKQLVETYRYSAFGEIQIYGPDHSFRNSSSIGNPWRYFSKRYDEESGLVYFGRRYYHPKLARWISPDPAQDIDHNNLYLFLRANPLNLYDALGLYAQPQNWYMPPRPENTPTPFSNGLNYAISTAVRPLGYALYYGGYQLPVPGVRDGLLMAGSSLARNKRCQVEHSGLYYIEGNGRRDGNEYMVTNGINTTMEEALQSGKKESAHLNNHPVWVNFNASNGLILDLIDSALALGGVETRAVRVTKRSCQTIYNHGKQYAEDPKLALRSHSEGCILTQNAFTSLNKTHPEIGQHTTIYALGSPVILDPNLANTVDIRISSHDAVGWIDVIGRFRKPEHLQVIPSKGGLWGCDHGINGETYGKELEKIHYQLVDDWEL